MTEKIKIEQHSSSFFIWCAGWLFSIGILDLGLRQGILAFFVWPYYIGVFVRNLVG